jgi:hypothetical protein
MSTITELIEQAESLLRKKIAIKESVPGVFEALSNVDDQLRITINEIISSGLDEELDSAQVNLINTALVGTRSAIASYQNDYRPTVNDLTAEFTILPQINLRNLRKLKERDSRLYEALVKDYGVINETDFSRDFGGEDLSFLENKEAVYEILAKYSDRIGYIDDNIWYGFVSDARSKEGYLWNNLPQAAKFLQERYGFEFNVKFLENPKGEKGGKEEAMPF